MAVSSYIPLRELFSTWNDSLMTAADGASILDKVGIQDFKITEASGTTTISLTVAFDGELGLSVPGVDGLGVYLGTGGTTTTLKVEADVNPAFAVRLPDLAVTLRLPPSILRPVEKQGEKWVARTQADGSPAPYEITLSGIAITVNGEGDIDLTFPAGAPAIALAPAMIGDSGIVIESKAIGFFFSSTATLPAGAPAGFKGLFIEQATVHLPDGLSQVVPDELKFSGCYIGTGGFTGEIDVPWKSELTGSLFGIDFGLKSIGLGFTQNALTKSEIAGSITLPFFDKVVDVAICIAANGTWAVELTGATGGLLELKKPGIVNLKVDSLGFGEQDGRFLVVLSGAVTPDFGSLDWPTVELKELSIDSEGNVRVAGGWLDLGTQATLDLHGFQVEMTKIGFGNETDGSKWVGFSGGLRLVDGMAGAKVDGLKILWDSAGKVHLSLSGVGVEFEIPEVLRFSGYLEYTETGGPRFAGEVKLSLLSLGLEIDAILVVGTDETKTPAFTYFGLYLGVDLPAGIPLWATGLGLYGMAGLFTINYTPNKADKEQWYEDWYKRTPEGVTDLIKKWAPEDHAFALGGGVTIGTVSDNGYTFSGRLLLVIVLPGPVIMLEGRANFLAKRSELSADPIFRALAVLDGRAGTLEFGLGAQWKYDKAQGYIIEIGGDSDVFFSFHDASAWHIYLGQKDPVEKRIRALIFTFLEANTYFMIDPTGVATGAWVGIDKHWGFGPAQVSLEAWLEGNAALSWKPVQFHGDAWLHGAVNVAIFGFGFDISADAKVAIDTPSPYRIYAGIDIKVGLPWPFHDFKAKAELEWTKTTYDLPVPMPLAEVAVEHLKTSDSWLLPAIKHLPSGHTQPYLLPEYSDGQGFIGGTPAAPTAAEEDAARLASPVVPLDSRPHLTFGRAVHDVALVGVNPQPPSPAEETVGTETMRFSLTSVKLQKYNGAAWDTKAAAPAGAGEKALYGSWAPVPAIPRTSAAGDAATAQTKLWLWSVNPYDYTAKSSRAWDDWFGDTYENYPCVPDVEERELCYDFEKLAPGATVTAAYHHPDDPGVIFDWHTPPAESVVDSPPYPVEGRTHSLYFKHLDQPGMQIQLHEPARAVAVLVARRESARATGYTTAGATVGPVYAGKEQAIILEAPDGQELTTISVEGADLWFMGICVRTRSVSEAEARAEMASHMLSELTRWTDEGAVLEPDSYYRLEIQTEVKRSSGATNSLTEHAYFRTQGPPALADYSEPVQWPGPKAFSTPLSDLSPYVQRSMPDSGQKPVYRAYDVGVSFNETYVELMYRLAGRDLGIYLYDSNSQPLRDAAGRLLILSNAWGKEKRSLTASEERWVHKVNQSDCAALDPEVFAKTDALAVADEKVLKADLVHSARLIPLLLHEDFSEGTAGWSVVDESGTAEGPSVWKVGSETDSKGNTWHYVTQSSNLNGGTDDGLDPVKPGTLFVRGDATWTDYLLTATVRSGDDDAIGLVFRRQDNQNFYRFAMDRQRRYRRLVKVVGGVTTILAEDQVPYQMNQDYQLTVAAVGSRIDVYVDGEQFCSLEETALSAGGIGLYCWGNTGARFADIQVHDFRAKAPVAYQFNFTTSHFANFHHQSHSFQDETWSSAAGDASGLTAALAAAVTPGAAPVALSASESAGYEAALTAIFGSPARQLPAQVQASRVDKAAWLLESPEPIDWTRTTVSVSTAGRAPEPGDHPRMLKLTGATWGSTATPDDEQVSLVVRDAFDPTDYQVEAYLAPGPAPAPDQTLLLSERFAGQTGGLLFGESFGPAALNHWSIVDEGVFDRPSKWMVTGGYITQLSNIHGSGFLNPKTGKISPFLPKGGKDTLRKGTMAVTGDPVWTDYRLTVTMQPMDDDAIGVLVRYTDPDNYYRFAMDQQGHYRRLLKRYQGKTTVLWEEAAGYTPGAEHTVAVAVFGSTITGFLDGVFLFDVTDNALKAGKISLYCSAHKDARFKAIQVDALAHDPVLWHPDLASLDGWTATGPHALRGTWKAASGTVTKVAISAAASPKLKGMLNRFSYLVGGDPSWGDVEFSVRMAATKSGTMGAVMRYADEQNFYQFIMDRTKGRRALVRVVAGVPTVLWQVAGPGYTLGTSYNVTLRAEGSRLSGYVNGALLFTVTDAAIGAGRTGLCATGATAAAFDRVHTGDRTRWVGQWAITDEGNHEGPSRWRIDSEALTQTANIWGGTGTFGDAHTTGTYAVAGDPAWTDYRLRASMRSDDNDLIGVMLRYQDRNNYYLLTLDAERKKRRLTRKRNGTVTTLWEDSVAYVCGQPFTLTVDVVGQRLTGYYNGGRIFAVTDGDALATGQVGLFCSGDDSARFDWVSVAEPPADSLALFRDRFAEGDTAGWSIVDEGTGSPSVWSVVTSGAGGIKPHLGASLLGTQDIAGDGSWTDYLLSARLASGTGGAMGLCFRYTDPKNFYRFSVSATGRQLTRYAAATHDVLWSDSQGVKSGQEMLMAVSAVGNELRGYIDGVPVFRVADSAHASGKVGLYCSNSPGAAFASVRVWSADQLYHAFLLDDRFDGKSRLKAVGAPAGAVGTATVWTAYDEAEAATAKPSAWAIGSGLTQTSAIAGTTASGMPAGTCVIPSVEPGGDYRLSVRLQTNGSGAIGVFFRYTDLANHYRFVMDRAVPYRRLYQVHEGVATLLWHDGVAMDAGREYIFTADCAGDAIAGYLDGVELFRLGRAALTAGTVGLFTSANTAATFREVRLGEAGWVFHYRFGQDEAPLEAGTRIAIHSGNAAAMGTSAEGVQHRYAAGDGETDNRHLQEAAAASGARLRLVGPDGTAEHDRTFVPTGEFSHVPARILRRADGTGLLIAAGGSGASVLSEGVWRLSFTYRRDNTAAVPASVVLSQAGNRDNETAVLDLSWKTR